MPQRTSENPPQLSISAIRKMHRFLGKELSGLLKVNVSIPEDPDVEWVKVKPGTPTLWRLVGQSPSEWADFGGRGELVVPLPGTNATWWVTWVEKWRKSDGRDFVFWSAGWRIFFGSAGFERSKQLVLRAEWGPIANGENSGSSLRNGQPHWHTEMVLPTPTTDSLIEEPGRTEGDDIRIIDADAEASTGTVPPGFAMDRAKVNLNRVHLGMAGWQNKPHAWQMAVDDDFAKSLRTWSVATLTYLREQLSRFAAT